MMRPSTTLRCASVCVCVRVLWVYTSRTQSQWILLTAPERGRHGEGRWSRVNGWFILSLKCSSFSSYKESSAGWKWSGAREKSGKWSWEAACFFFLLLFDGDIHLTGSRSLLLYFHLWPVTHFLSACLPASPVCRSLSALYKFHDGPFPNKKGMSL